MRRVGVEELSSNVRNCYHMLLDDGVGHGDHLKQIACLFFLNVSDKDRRPASGWE